MMNFSTLDYPVLSEKYAWEVMFLQRRIAYICADYNDEYGAGTIRNMLNDVSSIRKLVTSVSDLLKHLGKLSKTDDYLIVIVKK